MGKHLCEIFKETYFKEHLYGCFKLTLRSIVWNLISGSHLKPSRLNNITKIPVAYKSELFKKNWRIYSLYLTPTLFCDPRFQMFIINSYYTKSKLRFLVKRCNNILLCYLTIQEIL